MHNTQFRNTQVTPETYHKLGYRARSSAGCLARKPVGKASQYFNLPQLFAICKTNNWAIERGYLYRRMVLLGPRCHRYHHSIGIYGALWSANAGGRRES